MSSPKAAKKGAGEDWASAVFLPANGRSIASLMGLDLATSEPRRNSSAIPLKTPFKTSIERGLETPTRRDAGGRGLVAVFGSPAPAEPPGSPPSRKSVVNEYAGVSSAPSSAPALTSPKLRTPGPTASALPPPLLLRFFTEMQNPSTRKISRSGRTGELSAGAGSWARVDARDDDDGASSVGSRSVSVSPWPAAPLRTVPPAIAPPSTASSSLHPTPDSNPKVLRGAQARRVGSYPAAFEVVAVHSSPSLPQELLMESLCELVLNVPVWVISRNPVSSARQRVQSQHAVSLTLHPFDSPRVLALSVVRDVVHGDRGVDDSDALSTFARDAITAALLELQSVEISRLQVALAALLPEEGEVAKGVREGLLLAHTAPLQGGLMAPQASPPSPPAPAGSMAGDGKQDSHNPSLTSQRKQMLLLKQAIAELDPTRRRPQ